MAFLGGAECSTAANPLAQFSKHAQDDRSQLLDRQIGPRESGPATSIRAQGPIGGQDAMMEGFLQTTPTSQSGAANFPLPMSGLENELASLQMNPSQSPGALGNWEREFNTSLHFNPAEGSASNQKHAPFGLSMAERGAFNDDVSSLTNTASDGKDGQLTAIERSGLGLGAATSDPVPAFARTGPYHRPGFFANRFYGLNSQLRSGSLWQSGAPLGRQQALQDYQVQLMMLEQHAKRRLMLARDEQKAASTGPLGKGKGRLVELDKEWEERFSQIASQELDEDAKTRLATEEQLDGLDRSMAENMDRSDLASLWTGIHAEKAGGNDEWTIPDVDWEEHMNGMGIHEALDTRPDARDYVCEDNNPFQDVPDPFEEGVKIMEEGGSLSLAALAFEVAVSREPERSEAWSMLGHAQAQNEKEMPAIRALEQALKLDPSDLSALMGLAVSYTNEAYDSSAYHTLERWLATKYPDLVDATGPAAETDLGFGDRHALRERVTSLFIRAAQLSPAGEQMDPDVQVGLGVLFYGAAEYDKAVDCFSAALASTESGTSNRRQQLHLLWNRLGATLANSGRSDEAVAAYEKALTLRPNFVRARYNLGVSCINLACYDAAAQHLLGALAMHKVAEQDGRARARHVVGDDRRVSDRELERLLLRSTNPSANLYDALRRVLVQLDRHDLVRQVGPNMDLDAFRQDFDF